MARFTLDSIGTVAAGEGGFALKLDEKYAPALRGLEGFSHVLVLWWASECDFAEARALLSAPKPYTNGPEEMGTFATRSPARPNPVAVSAAGVLGVDGATLRLDWIDAEDGTPVLDVKPYTPSSDRVEAPGVPAWCAHWPKSLETSEDFDWAAEFNF